MNPEQQAPASVEERLRENLADSNPSRFVCVDAADVQSVLDAVERLSAERDEAQAENTRWLLRMESIREASGVGVLPMLSELPDAIAAKMAVLSAEREGLRANHFVEPNNMVAAVLAALATQGEAPQEGGWQDIATAPKTDEANMVALSFIGWCPEPEADGGGDQRICWWEPKTNGGQWWSDRDLPEKPTLWRSLPAAPTPADSPTGGEG